MNAPPNQFEKNEVASAAPATAEAVNVAATAEVFVTQAETTGRAAEIMGSVESSEVVSESGEAAEDGEGYGEGEQTGKGKAAAATATVTTPPPVSMPTSDKALRQAVAAAIRAEMRADEKKVLLAYVGWEELPADKLAPLLIRIRSLKNLLASLVAATTEVLKNLYVKWVQKA